MSLILTPRHGYVKVLQEPAAPGVLCPGYPSAPDNWPGFDAIRCIITRVQLSFAENFQFQHSLNKTIYVYTFGSRIGEAVITGLAFGLVCGDGEECGAQGPNTGPDGPQGEANPLSGHGIEKLIKFYNDNKITAGDLPFTVSVGLNTCFAGFLTGMSTDVLDPKIDLYQFSLRVHVVPEDICPA